MPGAIGRPLYYQQVADDLRSQVVSGALPVGSAIPSTAQLMKIYEVSNSAARAAVAELRRQGIVVGQPGKAVYVRATPEMATEEHANVEALGKEVRGLREEIQQLRDLTTRGDTAGSTHSERPGEIERLRCHVELIGSHLISFYERVGQPYPYDSLNEVTEQSAADVAKGGR